MPLAHRVVTAVVACALTVSGVRAADRAPLAPATVGWGHAPQAPDGAPPSLAAGGGRTPDARPGASPAGAERAAAYPTYAFPLARAIHDGLLVVNYVDLDPSAGVLDYSSGTHTYDGHRGIDYTLFDFRMMDRGCIVRAAAPGTVAYMSTPSPYDRHCDFDWPDDGNWVWVANGDGTYSEYYHLRANSMTVQLGEAVTTGEMLGLVGSSGYATAPHLHFETGDYFGGPYAWRDPYHGPSNPLPSLWNAQDDYEGDDPLWFADLGVYSESEVGGNISNTSYCDITERLSQPVSFGAGEGKVCIWVKFQGRAGDPGRIEVRRPDNSLYASYDFTLSQKAQFDWFWVYWFWNPYVTPADYGTWTVRALSNGVLSNSRPFTVGASTVFGPRFWPRDGRSFRINGSVQRDTLRRSPLGGPVTFSLLGAPPTVTLTSDSILTIGATSTQAARSAFFEAIATDGAARRDTAWFHLVDMSKPVGPPVGVGQEGPPGTLEFALAGTNPARGATALRYRLGVAGRVSLGVYDLRGRCVRSLVERDAMPAGEPVTVLWDGRDRSGRALPGGIYLARLNAGGTSRMLKLVRLP